MFLQSGLLDRMSQHHGGEPEQAKGAAAATVCLVDCIACTVDAERSELCSVNNSWVGAKICK